MDFNKINQLIKESLFTSESLAPKIGMTANGLRKALRNESLSLVKYDQMCKVLKVHPMFIWDLDATHSDYQVKRSNNQLQLTVQEVDKLRTEINQLKDLNIKLQSRLIEMIDNEKKKKR